MFFWTQFLPLHEGSSVSQVPRERLRNFKQKKKGCALKKKFFSIESMGNRTSKTVSRNEITKSDSAQKVQSGVEEYKKENDSVEIKAVCGIVFKEKPKTPDDDVLEEYIWKMIDPHNNNDVVTDQINGYIFAGSAYNQYKWLRKSRHLLNQ